MSHVFETLNLGEKDVWTSRLMLYHVPLIRNFLFLL